MTTTEVIGGLEGAVGSDFVQAQKRLLFVEYGGRLSRYDLFPAATVVSQGTAVLKGTFHFDFDTGTQSVAGDNNAPFDVFWDQATNVIRSMRPENGAAIVNIGVTNFASVLPQALPGLPYSSTPIDGNNDTTNKLVTGDVFAVKTNQGNYAKVLVTAYGYDIGIEWVTYKMSPAYAVLGTGYLQPEDVAASADGIHAYVVERPGNLLKVPLASANRTPAMIFSNGMNAPQQMVLDEPHGVAYVVEYAASGRLLKVSLANGQQTVLLTGLNYAVGLAMSADGQTAYISEQGTGTVTGYALPGGAKTVLATGLGQPFFLTWSDDTQTTLYVTERSAANAVVAIGVTTPATQTVLATGVGTLPSCVAVIAPGNLLVTTNTTLDEVELGPVMEAGAPLLQGIGFVPVSYIIGGYANTAADPSYFFPALNVPFAGSLPVMVNFLEALAQDAAYYQVKVGGTVRTDQFNTVKWNGTTYAPAVFGPETISGEAYYPVPSISDLELWYPGLPGCYLDSTTLPNAAKSTIEVSFFKANLTQINPVPAGITVYVDNSPAQASISNPVLDGVPATTLCGYMPYTNMADDVSISYTASQPQGHASYSFSVVRGIGAGSWGVNGLPVTPPPTPFSESVSTLLGTCKIAGFAAEVYVATTATTGWGRAGGLDASAAVAFVLAPA
jgi:hypothetical protein